MPDATPHSAQHERPDEPLPFVETGKGPTVVLVDGASPPTWGDLADRLATRHRVVTYVRRGFPPCHNLPLARRLRDHTDDLAVLLDTCGPATVVGWSSGGTIALDLTLRRPDLVRRLVALEPPLHARRHPTPGLLRAVLGAQLAARRSPEAGALRFLTWALARSDGRPSDLPRLDEAAVRRAAPAIMRELSQATGEREISRRALAELTVDTHWLFGSASSPLARVLALAAARHSDRIRPMEVPGSGHAIQLDAPEALVAAVEGVRLAA